MSQSYTDTKITNTTWTDILSTTSFVLGDSIGIQNKASNNIVVSLTVDSPSDDSTDGVVVEPNEVKVFPKITDGMWVRVLNPKSPTIENVTIFAANLIDRNYVKEGQNVNIRDFEGKQVMNTVFGELTVADRTDYINVQFQYNISTKDVKPPVKTGTGNVQFVNLPAAELSTGTGVSTATLESIDAVRYITGREMLVNFTADFSAGEVNTYQWGGILDDNDGFAVGYQGVQAGMLFRSNAVDTFIPSTEFNMKPNWFDFEPTHYTIYKISYGWLGVAPAILSVYGGYGVGWVPLHVIDYSRGQNRPHLGNPVLPIRFTCGRTSGTGSNLTIHTSSWRGCILGRRTAGTTADRTFQKIIREKAISGSSTLALRPLITIRNKATYQGKINHVRARYGTVNISCDGAKDVIITVHRGGTLTGANYVDYNTADSCCQYDVSATAFTPVPGVEPMGGTILGKTDKVRINFFENDVVIPIYPNETVTLCADSSGNSIVNVFIRHIEEF